MDVLIYLLFLLHWILLAVYRCSLVVASGGYTLLVGNGLLIAVSSLVEHGSSRVDSVVVEQGLSCPEIMESSQTKV